jgi:hypothetical protein
MLYEHIYHYTPHSLKYLPALSGFRATRFLTGRSDGSSGRGSRGRGAVCRMVARMTGGLVNWHYPLACLARPAIQRRGSLEMGCQTKGYGIAAISRPHYNTVRYVRDHSQTG